MPGANRRFLLCFIISLVLHGALLLGAYLLSNGTLLQDKSDEIYEASTVVNDFVLPADSKIAEKVEKVAQRHVASIEFVMVDAKGLDRFFGKTGIIAREVTDKKLKEQRKVIPVVKNPAVQPKLTYYTPIPYPREAGGVTGTVVVCFLVGFDGVPEYTSTAESSGNRFLDAAAVETCINWRFSPARDAKGRLVRCLMYIPVTVQ